MSVSRRRFNREFKLAAVKRLDAGGPRRRPVTQPHAIDLLCSLIS